MNDEPALRRSIGFSMLVLYGLGTTIGGGIYVLIGEIVARAGMLAPLSFVLAAVLVAFSALSYAEFSSRFPKSGGEAMYVRHGFGRRRLALGVGLTAIFCGLVSSATLSIGFAGYVRSVFTDVLAWLPIVAILICIGLLAAWGIGESVAAAAIVTVVEIGGLLLVIWAASPALLDLPDRADALVPRIGDAAAWSGLLGATFLAFFAFIGFGDMVNVAEEVHDAERVVPRAVIATLTVTLALYVLVALTGVLAVPLDVLAHNEAPLVAISQSRAPWAGKMLSVIGMFAVLNGILIQIIMVSRIVHGMSREGWLPASLGRVHARTLTPVRATAMAVVLILALALAFPIGVLAEATSFLVLVVAGLVNAALVRLKLREARGHAPPHPQPRTLHLPLAVPLAGAFVSATCAALIALDLF